jgi:hypothetical protein
MSSGKKRGEGHLHACIMVCCMILQFSSPTSWEEMDQFGEDYF